MKKLIKEFLGFVLVKWFFLTGKKPDQVLSITFHYPSVAMFGHVLNWLSRLNYRIISLAELETVLDQATLQGNVAFITIDDAWQTNLQLLPLLESHQAPIAIFVPTEPVESGNYWWEFAKMKGQEGISGIADVQGFKDLPEETRRQKIDELRLNTVLNRSCMNRAELVELSKNPWVTLGSHTITHPILKNCSSMQQEDELRGSKRILENWLNKPVSYFAYPNGDYDARTLDLVKQSGYRLSFTDSPGSIQLPWSNKLEIPRNSLNDEGGYYENYAKLLGIWQKVFGES